MSWQGDEYAIHEDVAGEIAAVAEKVAPVDADLVLIEDSAATNAKKRVQIGNLPGGGGGVVIPQWIEYLAARQAGETASADDDFFDDASLDAAWTTLTVSGGQTITELYDILSVKITSGIAASQVNAILREVSPSFGDTIETRLRPLVTASGSEFAFGGLVWSDGVVAGSNASALMVHKDTSHGTFNVVGRAGTFTAMGGVVGPNSRVNSSADYLYVRLEYDASNSFIAYVSHDGVTWHTFGTLADTNTPTHVGVVWSNWGDAVDTRTLSYDYFRYNAA